VELGLPVADLRFGEGVGRVAFKVEVSRDGLAEDYPHGELIELELF
jgi:hypothetical protein